MATISPNLGLVFNKPAIDLPATALRDGLNFRCKNGTIESLNLGWKKFSTAWKLNGPVRMIDNFAPRNQDIKLIMADAQDIYLYLPNTDEIRYLTPQVGAGTPGTLSSVGTAVTLDGTPPFSLVDIAKPGDQIINGVNFYDGVNTNWRTIVTIDSPKTMTIDSPFIGGNMPTGTLYTIRTRFQNIADVQWDTATFMDDGTTHDDLWFATNGVDPIVTWNGTTDPYVVAHPELQFTCKSLANYRNMMIYGNVTQGGQDLFSTIINSDVGFPLRAGATGIQLSEQFVVHSNPDEILAMVVLGDYLIIYSQRTITNAQFVGDPTIFTFRQSMTGTGPIASNAIADFGDFHEFIGQDSGYSFDGVTLKEANTHVWREILKQTDPKRQREAYAHFNEEQGDLIWVVPATTDPQAGVIGGAPAIAWSEHYLESNYYAQFPGSPFSKRTFPFTATGYWQSQNSLLWQDADFEWQSYNFAWNDKFFSTAFPTNLAGDETGQIYEFDSIQTADDQPLPSFVRTGRAFLTTGRELSLLRRVYPFTPAYPGSILEVTVYMTKFLGADPQATETFPYDLSLPDGGHFVSIFRRGRAYELAFGSSTGDAWSLSGWDVDITKGGMR